MKVENFRYRIRSTFAWIRNRRSEIANNIRQSPSFNYFSRIYKESTPVIMITTLAETFAGLILAQSEELLLLIPGLIIIVPSLMASRGNIVTSLSQRLGTSVHLGIIKWELGVNREILTNFYATMILNICVALIMGVLGYITAILIGIEHMSLMGYILATLLMALVMGFLLTILTIFTVLIAHRLKFDPDNVTVPIVATLGDIATVGFLVVLVRFLEMTDEVISIL